MTVRVIVADDHTLFRVGLIRMLRDIPEVSVVAEAADGDEATAIVGRADADILILDLTMPGLTGVPLIERVRQIKPALPILVLSMHDEPVTVRWALAAGASGYVTKSVDLDVLEAAISSLLAGETYVAPDLAAGLALDMCKPARSGISSLPLSNREQEVLALIARGFALTEIAEKLNLSPKTVTTHKCNLMEKLKLENNAELIRYALERGVV